MIPALKRALSYPYALEETSYVLKDGAVLAWADVHDLSERTPVLACGSNQSPEQLLRKFPRTTLPVMAGWIDHYDSVYSAHLTSYGSVAATLIKQPHVRSRQMITWLDAAQLDVMHRSEALGVNYDFVDLSDITFVSDEGQYIRQAFGYVSRHGPLKIKGQALALHEICAEKRGLCAWRQAELQDQIRKLLAPQLTLEEFVMQNIETPDIRARRTAELKRL